MSFSVQDSRIPRWFYKAFFFKSQDEEGYSKSSVLTMGSVFLVASHICTSLMVLRSIGFKCNQLEFFMLKKLEDILYIICWQCLLVWATDTSNENPGVSHMLQSDYLLWVIKGEETGWTAERHQSKRKTSHRASTHSCLCSSVIRGKQRTHGCLGHETKLPVALRRNHTI